MYLYSVPIRRSGGYSLFIAQTDRQAGLWFCRLSITQISLRTSLKLCPSFLPRPYPSFRSDTFSFSTTTS